MLDVVSVVVIVTVADVVSGLSPETTISGQTTAEAVTGSVQYVDI